MFLVSVAVIAANSPEDNNVKSLGNSEGISSGDSEPEVMVDECSSSYKGIASICSISLLMLLGRVDVWLLIGIF